jgi:4-aminobutyrate aminotransferase-like enzyme
VIQNVRGRGMIMGFDLFQTRSISSQEMGDTFVELCENEGLLLQHCNYGKTIRLLPNYCVSDQEIDEFLDKLNAVCSKIVSK